MIDEPIESGDSENTSESKHALFLRLARDAYSGSEQYLDSYLRQNWEDSLAQWQSKHKEGSKYHCDAYASKSKLFRPRTRSVIRKNEASCSSAYFSTESVINIVPQNDSDEFVKMSAEIIQALMNYHLTTTIPWFQTVTGAYQNAQVYGQVCSYQYWKVDENGHDYPVIDLRPIENIRIDANADWIDPINSSPYVIDLIPMYLMDVKAKMASGAWIEASDSIIKSSTGEYYDSTRMAREDRDDPTANHHTDNNEFTTVWVRRNMIRHDGTDWLYYTLGDNHLLTEPEELQTVCGKRPYVMGACIIEANRVYPSSVPELTKDVQSEINNITNQRLDNVKLALNKRFHAKRNRKIDINSLTKNVAGSVTLMDNLDDVRVFDVPDVTSSSYNEQDRLNLDFDDLAGVFSGSSVQANRNLNETVGGMNMMNQSANQLSEYQLRTFTETWSEPVLRQILELTLRYEDSDTAIDFASNNSKLFAQSEYGAVTQEMLDSKVTLSVSVGTGSTNPQTQVERFFYGLNSLSSSLGEPFINSLNRQEVIREAFGKLGYKDGDRFINDAGGNGDTDPRLAEMQAMIEELQRKLELKIQPEEMKARIDKMSAETKRIDAETVNASVEATFSAMSSAEKIAMFPMIIDTATQILNSAGFKDMDNVAITPPTVTIPQTPTATNTNPNTPLNPDLGINAGIESGINE